MLDASGYTALQMKRYVVLDKKIGETPLSAIQTWMKQHEEYATLPACYAGRLDPMASGKLLILLGEECKKQRSYTDHDKEYEIEVLLGVGSDTGDALGKPIYAREEIRVDTQTLAAVLRREHGAHSRAYPAFSSKTVQGKPLFLHTLEGTLVHEDIPEHIEHIYRIRNLETNTISDQKLAVRVSKFLDLVPRTTEPSKRLGEDFRVDAIRADWESLFKETSGRNFSILHLKVVCASGTYMRSLAGRIGESLGTKALALSIKRTKIGKYVPLLRGMGFWTRTF